MRKWTKLITSLACIGISLNGCYTAKKIQFGVVKHSTNTKIDRKKDKLFICSSDIVHDTVIDKILPELLSEFLKERGFSVTSNRADAGIIVIASKMLETTNTIKTEPVSYNSYYIWTESTMEYRLLLEFTNPHGKKILDSVSTVKVTKYDNNPAPYLIEIIDEVFKSGLVVLSENEIEAEQKKERETNYMQKFRSGK